VNFENEVLGFIGTLVAVNGLLANEDKLFSERTVAYWLYIEPSKTKRWVLPSPTFRDRLENWSGVV
jgi:hypothetical protein